jgi:hypothetical protein
LFYQNGILFFQKGLIFGNEEMEHEKWGPTTWDALLQLTGGKTPVFVKPNLPSKEDLEKEIKKRLLAQQNIAGEPLWWPPEDVKSCLTEMLNMSNIPFVQQTAILLDQQIKNLEKHHLTSSFVASYLHKQYALSLQQVIDFEAYGKWIKRQKELEMEVLRESMEKCRQEMNIKE